MHDSAPLAIFIDTNVFLRTLIREDTTTFDECVHLLKRVKDGSLTAFTNQLVLAEVAWTLRSFYNFKKSEVCAALESIELLRGLDYISEFDRQLAIKLYRDHTVKYIDACIASIEKVSTHTMVVVSYDSDFAKLPVIWKKPRQV